MSHTINWTTRWLGGMCAPGVACGLPVRGTEYNAQLPLAEMLPLPFNAETPTSTLSEVENAWSKWIGAEVILVRNVATARRMILNLLDLAPGDSVALPANATRDLVEAVKRHRIKPHFLSISGDLSLQVNLANPPTVIWSEGIGGLRLDSVMRPTVLDYADTVPTALPPFDADVMLWGLHLNPRTEDAGALVFFRDPALTRTIRTERRATDLPDPARAAVQAQRVAILAEKQASVLHQVSVGLRDAAGLPLYPFGAFAGLAHHIAVRIPDEVDVATFYAYVMGENTPVAWLATHRAMHYAAVRDQGLRGEGIAKWILVPVGPDYTFEEISHATLGIAKAADYLGIRWYTDPTQATHYADLMDKRYGQNHDAYRPRFSIAKV